MQEVNLKQDMPTVAQALSRMLRELDRCRHGGHNVVKLIHGYGSTGIGGEIRIAVQARLQEMVARGEISARIFGEDWSKSDQCSWDLLRKNPALKSDRDLGRKNPGITIVVF